MATITKRYHILNSDGSNFEGSANNKARLVKSDESGADNGLYGYFTYIGHGFWDISLSSDDSGWYKIQITTDNWSSYSNLSGYNPFQIIISNTVNTQGDQTIAGIKTFTGNNVHNGDETFNGYLDIGSSSLRIASDEVTASADELNKLSGVSGSVVGDTDTQAIDNKQISSEYWRSATTTTVSNTPTDIVTLTLEDDSLCYLEVKILGLQDDSKERGVFHYSGLFYRLDGSGAMQEGSTADIITPIKSSGATALGSSFNVNGNDIDISVTGIVDETFKWFCLYRYIILSE